MNVKYLVRFLPLVLILLLILFACSRGLGQDPAESNDPNSSAAPTATVRPTASPKPTASAEPVVYTHPLTGEILEEPFPNTRPLAISINNVPGALPQVGISGADIIFEVLMEGATRMIALYSSVDDVGIIGSVRSIRPYFVDLALGYDAILIHAGASVSAYSDIRSKGLDVMDGVNGPYGEGTAFYRDPNRSYMAYEHRLVTTDERIKQYIGEGYLDYRLDHEGESFDYGLQFTEDAVPEDGESAQSVRVIFAHSGKGSRFTYSETNGTYTMSQTYAAYSGNYIDGATNESVAFDNVLIIYTPTVLTGDALGHVDIETEGSGEGFFLCGGKYIDIKWERSSNEPFRFTDADGDPLKLSVGKTFISIVPISNNSSVTFE